MLNAKKNIYIYIYIYSKIVVRVELIYQLKKPNHITLTNKYHIKIPSPN